MTESGSRLLERRFIAVDGPIGVGATSLASALAAELDAKLMREPLESNPFIEQFYAASGARRAFQTELSFLMARRAQLFALSKARLDHGLVIADYHFERDLIFAQVNLDHDEISLYKEIFDLASAGLPTPGLLIYLSASSETLLRRIKIRARPIELSISAAYIDSINEAFNRFYFSYKKGPLLIINTDKIDFVANPSDFERLRERLDKPVDGLNYFNPAPSERSERPR